MRIHGLPVSGGVEVRPKKKSWKKWWMKGEESGRRREREDGSIVNGSWTAWTSSGPSVKRDSYAPLPVSGSLVSPVSCTSLLAIPDISSSSFIFLHVSSIWTCYPTRFLVYLYILYREERNVARSWRTNCDSRYFVVQNLEDWKSIMERYFSRYKIERLAISKCNTDLLFYSDLK